MNKLRKKLNKQGGFTLIEMLIVVAIIAILIAVSIPIVGTALERARHAVDDANMRSAAALGNIVLLTEDEAADAVSHVVTRYYKISADGGSQGSLVDSKANGTVGQCKGVNTTDGCVTGGRTEKVLEVQIDYSAGKVTVSWVDKS